MLIFDVLGGVGTKLALYFSTQMRKENKMYSIKTELAGKRVSLIWGFEGSKLVVLGIKSAQERGVVKHFGSQSYALNFLNSDRTGLSGKNSTGQNIDLSREPEFILINGHMSKFDGFFKTI